MCIQAASSDLPDQAPEGICALQATDRPSAVIRPPQGMTDPFQDMTDPPRDMTDHPQGMIDPPQDMTDPPQGMTDPSEEESEAEQPALVANLICATCNQQAEHANQQALCANREVLHPAEVQQAKPKLMVPIFQRRTCALPVSITPQGPNPLGYLVGSPGAEGPTDLDPSSSRAATEDMIEEEMETGNSMLKCQHCKRGAAGCAEQDCLQSSRHEGLMHLCLL